MASYEYLFHQDLTKEIQVRQLGTLMFMEDKLSVVLRVKVSKNNEPVDLSEHTITAAVILPNGAYEPLAETCSVDATDSSIAQVILTKDCLCLPGRIQVVLRASIDESVTGLLAVSATVIKTTSETIYDPANEISFEELLALVERCEEATEQAESAANLSVRYDTAQTKTGAEKATARSNIGAASTACGSTPALLWAQGSINANGINVDSNTVIRTTDILLAHAASTLRLTIANGYKAQLKIYNSTGTYIKTVPGIYTHITGDYLYSLEAGQRVRIVLRNSAETAIVPSEASNIALEFGGNDSLVEIRLPYSATTATITAFPGAIYTTANAMTEINFTPSEFGVCGLVFASGSTPTVLTLPQTVKMPDWWVGVEAGRTYEISIMNGVYGAVMSWTT